MLEAQSGQAECNRSCNAAVQDYRNITGGFNSDWD